MGKIQSYISDETVEKIEEMASENNISISQMSGMLIEKATNNFNEKEYFDKRFDELIQKISVVLGLSHDIFRCTFDSEKSKFPSENSQDALQKLKENVQKVLKKRLNR